MLAEKWERKVEEMFEERGEHVMSIKYIADLMLSTFHINCFFQKPNEKRQFADEKRKKKLRIS